MLFDDVVKGHVRALRAFFAAPSCGAMILRVDPDIELVAARFLALLGDGSDKDPSADEPALEDDAQGGDEISFGASLDFLEPRAFYVEAAAQLAEVVAAVRDAYIEEGEDIQIPDGLVLDRAWPPQASIEALFAEYLEQVARGLSGYHSTVVFALRIDAMPDPMATALSLARLGGYLVHPAVKLIVFDDRQAPRLPTLRSVRTRYVVDTYQLGAADFEGQLSRFLASDDKRVLGLRVQQHNLRQMWDQVASLPGRGVPVKPLYVEDTFEDRTHFANCLYRHVATGHAPPPEWVSRELAASGLLGQAWPDPVDLPPDIYDMRATDLPESTLTELLERAVPNVGVRCLVLRPHVRRMAEAWPTFVRELVGAAVALDMRYIVLAVDDNPRLPEVQPEEYEWPAYEFVLSVEHMQTGLEAAVKRPDLPLPDRVQCLTMLAGLRASQGRLDEAADTAAQSIELSEANGLRAQTIAAWWTLGRTLQLANNYEFSRNAYAESTNAALDEGSTLDAANSLMGLGHTYYLEQNWLQAIETYAVALEHWKNGGQVFGECQALLWTGEAYRKAQAFAQSEAAFQAVVERYELMRAPFEDMGRAGLADVFERLAALHREVGNRALADEFQARARQHGSHGPVPDQPS